MSDERNIMSPPHRPGHCPVMLYASWLYCRGELAGSLLCWPETTLVPVIARRRLRTAVLLLAGKAPAGAAVCTTAAVSSRVATAAPAVRAARGERMALMRDQLLGEGDGARRRRGRDV